MKVFLSNMCTSLVGLLNPELGYFLVERKGGFFSQRSRWGAPRDGHWRFIVLCAELAQNRLYISDIRIEWEELQSALDEAKYFIASEIVRRNHIYKNKDLYDARDIINLKTTFGL